MNDIFEKRVRAAAVAGWWVVLIALAFIVLQWLIYLAVIHARPAWVLSHVGAEHRLGFRPDGLVLGHSGSEVHRVAAGADRPLVDPVGEAVAEADGR